MNYEFYSNTTKCENDWQSTINQKENEDRYIVSKALPLMLNEGATDITYQQTPINCRIDAKCSCVYHGLEYKFNVEIKNYTHTHTANDGTRDCIHLKQTKLNAMYRESEDVNAVLFAAIFNHKIYWFNCKKIDWNNVYGEWKRQKVQQYNPNSEWRSYYTYSLPLSMAYRVVPCGEYEIEWQNGGIYQI